MRRFTTSKVKVAILSMGALLLFTACTKCDPKTPDTKINRDALEGFLNIKAGKEITEVFFYADEFIQDPAYYFAFSASEHIVKKIIEKLELKKLPDVVDRALRSDIGCRWWSRQEREKSVCYEYKDEKKCRQLWYNTKTQKCQICIFYF